MNRGELIHEVQRRGGFSSPAEADTATWSLGQAKDHARMVRQVLLGAVSAGKRDDVVAQLPREYVDDLLAGEER